MPNTVVTLLKGCAEGMCGHVGAACEPMEYMNRVTHEHPEAQDVVFFCVLYTTGIRRSYIIWTVRRHHSSGQKFR
jgi:hypothetical protein